MSGEDRYRVKDTVDVYAYQLDYNRLERSWKLFRMLEEQYDETCEISTTAMSRPVVMVGEALVPHLSWVVLDENIRVLSDKDFQARYDKAVPVL